MSSGGYVAPLRLERKILARLAEDGGPLRAWRDQKPPPRPRRRDWIVETFDGLLIRLGLVRASRIMECDL